MLLPAPIGPIKKILRFSAIFAYFTILFISGVENYYRGYP
ncbi:hypothetical protein GPLA_3132 [Paraglaciecola polaris LMG 21857]|uniref:Uncharacterized protein n=1 Tax=Paraglaciecola polaris LMG 21857 TaxID=1129793 RepID=K6ZZ61_9ALTE|nr:hypothetical protein GPLA_3132 [Paraglaciecola polaris LMG 21857]